MNVNFGYFAPINNEKYMCTFDSNCQYLNSYGNTFICAKGYLNPNHGSLTFDNIGNAFITVFAIVTLQGWSKIFTFVSKTFKDKIQNRIVLCFHPFV